MSESWKPAIQIWPFRDAPEEFRLLSQHDDKEELLVYIPPEFGELLRTDDWIMVMPPALWFMNTEPKRKGVLQYAGDNFGWYSLHSLPNGGRVVITADSEKERNS